MIGKVVGDYRILEKRGEGGMGMFFKAQDIRLDRFVGLKTIRAELLHDPEVLAKLGEEAKSLARLDHPNIARLLHYLVVDEQHYIVMEYVEGLDLAEKLRSGGALPLDVLAQIVPQVCAAIGYAHSRNVIHRDIKPSNLLLTADGTIKVTDFGIAKILGVSTKTKTGVATGSLPYMAPEQIRGGTVDARTDIYQLGITLFELLTGRRPFYADTEYDMMSHHLSTPPPRPSTAVTRIPAAVDQVIERALAKDPGQRFASAADLASHFRAAVGGSVPASVSDRTDYRAAAPPPIKSRKRWLSIGVPIFAAIAAVALVILLATRDRELKQAGGAATVPVAVTAVIPSGTPELFKAVERLWIRYPAGGLERLILTVHPETSVQNQQLAYDSAFFEYFHPVHAGDNIRRLLRMSIGDGVIFRMEISDSRGTLVYEGQTTASVSSDAPNEIRIGLASTSLATTSPADSVVPARRVAHETPTDSVGHGRGTGRELTEATTTQPANLTVDVQPITDRGQVTGMWIDGKKASGALPLAQNVPEGLRLIRWQIGDDTWTDTVTVGGEPLTKYLKYETSRGRINVVAELPDGQGSAEIWRDGRDSQQGTPAELRDVPAGPHQVDLRLAGYKVRGGPHIVVVPANGRTRVRIEMVRE